MNTTSLIAVSNINRIKENLSRWDELSPLKESQTKSIILLSQLNQFQLYDSDLNEELGDVKFNSELDHLSSSRTQQKNALQDVRKKKNIS